jgi:putative lipoic acid-binding regulatory protein
MDELASVELLQETHEFPGPYMFKVIGRAEHGFEHRVVAAIRDQMGSEVDPPFRVRQTPGGRHIAVTVEPVMETAWQVLAVYGRLRETEGLVMIL